MARSEHMYGHVPGVRFGDTFPSRDALRNAGLHAPLQAGIHGDSSKDGGAYSICLSEGYEDNRDNGDRVTYVGSGGQEDGRQVANQSFDDPPNQALLVSSVTKRPVRMIRGKSGNSYYAPASGYRYDGLYVVDSARRERGKSGFTMCFFELRRIMEEGDGPLPTRRLLDAKRLAKISRGR